MSSNSQNHSDLETLSEWIGKTEQNRDFLDQFPLTGLAALLNYDVPPWADGQLPPLAHWLYFLPVAREQELDNDGHPKRGGFLPPVPLERRMWAGGRLEFTYPLHVGDDCERHSNIADVKVKEGSSGRLVFVTVRHEIFSQGQSCLVEEQDIVYRDPVSASAATVAPSKQKDSPKADVVRTVTTTPITLFRFSALTFNAHRIHYDETHAKVVEGYEERVVHGPLLATMLADLFYRSAPEKRILRFSFRALKPLFVNTSVDLCLSWTPNGAKLWTQNEAGEITMRAEVDTD
jgi:3-methylfumaryl-CoA hydratase